MKLSSKILLACIILQCAISASAEVTSQYLNQAWQASPYPFESITAESGWFDQTELRYSGSDQNEHGLAFRFQPRFESQRLVENRIIDLLNQRQLRTLNVRLNDELKPRYQALIDLIDTYNELDYLEQKLALGHQKLSLHRALAETEAFRVVDLQSAEFEYHNDQQQMLRFDQRLNSSLSGFVGIPPALLIDFLSTWRRQVGDWDNFIDSGADLVQRVDSERLDGVVEQVDFELAQQKLRLARSDSASWLKFVELKLVDRASGDQEASLGISIPLGRNDFGIAQRAAEVNRANLSLQENRGAVSRSITDSFAQLKWFQSQADILESGEALLKQQHEKLRNLGQPVIVLKLKTEILRYQYEIRRLHIRGLRAYIELLHTAGYLAREPLTNWLLRTQPQLQR